MENYTEEVVEATSTEIPANNDGDPDTSKRTKIVQEILSTEQAYVQNMGFVIEVLCVIALKEINISSCDSFIFYHFEGVLIRQTKF